MKKYLTVVFEYDQGAKLPQELLEVFRTHCQYQDITITAVSLEDEITRNEQLEEDSYNEDE